MPVTRIPIDGLWRCLCPAIDGLAVVQAFPLRSGRKLPIRRYFDLQPCDRYLHSSSPARFEDTEVVSRKYETVLDSQIPPQSPQSPQLPTAQPVIHRVRAASSPLVRTFIPSSSSPPGILDEKQFARYRCLDDIPVTHLHERLRQTRNGDDEYAHIAELVEHLITERGEEPALIHYHALIRVNADANNGSAEVVEKLLKEMKADGVGADSELYHAVLQVLAIHPNYLLRNQVMQEMKERWLGLSPEGWHSLVVGLLRDRQFEAAVEKLDLMQSDGIHVQPWLYDIFLYQLCEVGELDEAFKVLRYRYDNRRTDIWHSMWYYLLDSFSSNFHYAGTKFVWKARIQTSQIVPSDGICVSTLNLAAREGDPGLATSAIRILASRRSALSPFHYEALLNAYTKAQDTKTAFRILTIMAKAGIEPDSSMTRPLFLHLNKDDRLPDKAWQVLKSLHRDGHGIPTAAVNVILEAKLHTGLFDQAVELYKELHTICESGPNTETFNILLQSNTRLSNKSMAMFFASEMRALGLKPDRLTYDRLILVCTHDDDYEDAFRYLEEMKKVGAEKGWWMRKGTAASLVQRCARVGDARVWHLLDVAEKRDLDHGKLRKWVEENWEGEERKEAKINETPFQ